MRETVTLTAVSYTHLDVYKRQVQDCLDRHVSDWGKIKNIIKDSLSDFLWKRMKRNPMILPIIMEV